MSHAFRQRSRFGVFPSCAAFGAALLLFADGASAQQLGGLSGEVTDNTGGVLPGVTVEVSSAALGAPQVAFTDGAGLFSMVSLPLGTYTVTFTLPGFSTVVREGITIGAGFTATVDAQMAVGSVEETITVTGEAPVVDVQTVRQQAVLDTEELEVLPVGNYGLQTIAQVTPGFTEDRADVGGTRDTWSAQGAYRFYHGKPGTRASFNGFRNQYYIGTASGSGYITNSDTIGEMQVEIAGMGAENGSGSTTINAIPREGSNTFTASLNTKYSGGGMQAENLTPELREFGIEPPRMENIWRAAGTIGGPILRDRLWYYGAVARWGRRIQPPGGFFNRLQGHNQFGSAEAPFPDPRVGGPDEIRDPFGLRGGPGAAGFYNTRTIFHELDPSRPAYDYDWNRTHAVRLTWQAAERHRFASFLDIQKDCRCTTGYTGQYAIENENGWDMWPNGVVQGSWTSPVTTRLLLEAGGGWQTASWVNFPATGVVDGQDRHFRDAGTGYRWGAPLLNIAPRARTGRSMEYFRMSYVTGSHNFRVGLTLEQAFNDEERTTGHQDTLWYLLFNGNPLRLYYYSQPYFQQERMNTELGLYVQDSWTVGNLTLTGGIRTDYVSMGFPASQLDAGPFVPARTVPELRGVPNWTDVNPRGGVSYDLTGDGRTAAKVSIGRFNELTRSRLTREFHPFTSSVSSAWRSWFDANQNWIPDCDTQNLAANGECGGIDNVNFGQFPDLQPDDYVLGNLEGCSEADPSACPATTFDPDVLYDNRPYTWDFLAEIQRELTTGLSVSAGYNRNWSGGYWVSDNLLTSPADYDEYCITAPASGRLFDVVDRVSPDQVLCGYYDVRPDLFGQSKRLVTLADKYGAQTRVWNGFVFSVDGRLPNGVRVTGGLDLGTQAVGHCFTVDEPNQPRDLFNYPVGRDSGVSATGAPNCSHTHSWGNLADFRMHGDVPLPSDFMLSWIYKNTPGTPINAVGDFTNADIHCWADGSGNCDPNSTRTGFAGSSTRTLAITAPNQYFTKRFTQLDLRFLRTFNLGGARLDTSIDLYNALNSNSVQSIENTIGLAFGRPITVLDARVLQVYANLRF